MRWRNPPVLRQFQPDPPSYNSFEELSRPKRLCTTCYGLMSFEKMGHKENLNLKLSSKDEET